MKFKILYLFLFFIPFFLKGETNITTSKVLEELWKDKDFKTLEEVANARLNENFNDAIGLSYKLEWLLVFEFKEKDLPEIKKLLKQANNKASNDNQNSIEDAAFKDWYRYLSNALYATFNLLESSSEAEKAQRRKERDEFLKDGRYLPSSILSVRKINPPLKDFAPGVKEFEEKAEEMRQEAQNHQSTEQSSYSETNISTNLTPTTNTAKIVQPTNLIPPKTNPVTEEQVMAPEKLQEKSHWLKWLLVGLGLVIAVGVMKLLNRKRFQDDDFDSRE